MEVLLKSRRRCCLCYFWDMDDTVKEGQIVHISRDPSDAGSENLVYLCLRHADMFDSASSQTKSITQEEIKSARDGLYRRFSEAANKVVVRLTIDRDFAEFTDGDAQRILELIKKVVATDADIRITKRTSAS